MAVLCLTADLERKAQLIYLTAVKQIIVLSIFQLYVYDVNYKVHDIFRPFSFAMLGTLNFLKDVILGN